MKRAGAAILVAALAAGALALPRRSPPTASSKPQAPLQLTARLVGDPHANSTCGLVVTATALADGDVTVDVALPPGLTRVGGERSFAAPLRRGEARELRMDVLVSGTQRREIAITGTLRQGTAKLTSVCTVVVNEDGSLPQPGGVQTTDARGRKILEYRE